MMPIQPARRHFLAKSLTGISVVVVGGCVWRATDQGVFSTGKGPAYQPWVDWRTDDTHQVNNLIRAAILAANPHNSQPWRFKISPAHLDVFADTRRNIGAIDPDRREMTMGLGCAIENICHAAAANGFAYQLSYLPTPQDPSHVARFTLADGNITPSDLYSAIPLRHTHRGLYDTQRPLSKAMLQAIQALGQPWPDVRVFWFDSAADKQRVGKGVIQATQAIIADTQQSADSAKWVRNTWESIQTHRDGITLDAQGLSPMIRAIAKILPPFSQKQSDEAWLKNTKEVQVASAAAFGILAVKNAKSPHQRLQGGQFWQRIHLWGTTQGLAMQPLNQMAERADREASLGIQPVFGDLLKSFVPDAQWQALMPFRIGYPQEPAQLSPRRDLQTVLG